MEITVTVTDCTELADGSGYNVALNAEGYGSLTWTVADHTGFDIGTVWTVSVAPAAV